MSLFLPPFPQNQVLSYEEGWLPSSLSYEPAFHELLHQYWQPAAAGIGKVARHGPDSELLMLHAYVLHRFVVGLMVCLDGRR